MNRIMDGARRLLEYLGVVTRPNLMYIGGSDILPAPLERDRRFLLCFKGVSVNMDHIAAQTGDELRLDDGSILPIAPRRRREILAQYRAYMFGRMREP